MPWFVLTFCWSKYQLPTYQTEHSFTVSQQGGIPTPLTDHPFKHNKVQCVFVAGGDDDDTKHAREKGFFLTCPPLSLPPLNDAPH